MLAKFKSYPRVCRRIFVNAIVEPVAITEVKVGALPEQHAVVEGILITSDGVRASLPVSPLLDGALQADYGPFPELKLDDGEVR